MGVTGLWQIIESSAQPVTLESLEGKRLAIDISLWLHQSIRGAAGHQNAGINPHLQTVFNRVIKLLFYRIRPVFVFDGQRIPVFKQRVLNERRMRREVAKNKLSKTHRQILRAAAQRALIDNKELNREDVIQQLLAAAASTSGDRTTEQNELYKITEELDLNKLTYEDSDEEDSQAEDEEPDEDEGMCGLTSLTASTQHAQQIDDPEFDKLPIELRRDLLRERHDQMKESRLTPALIPDDANEFSKFQLERLRQRNTVMQKFLKVGREFNDRLAMSTLGGSPEKMGGRVTSVVNEGRKRQHLLISGEDVLNYRTLGDIKEAEPAKSTDPSPSKITKLAGTSMMELHSVLDTHLNKLRQGSLDLLADVIKDENVVDNDDVMVDPEDSNNSDDSLIVRNEFADSPDLQAAIMASIRNTSANGNGVVETVGGDHRRNTRLDNGGDARNIVTANGSDALNTLDVMGNVEHNNDADEDEDGNNTPNVMDNGGHNNDVDKSVAAHNNVADKVINDGQNNGLGRDNHSSTINVPSTNDNDHVSLPSTSGTTVNHDGNAAECTTSEHSQVTITPDVQSAVPSLPKESNSTNMDAKTANSESSSADTAMVTSGFKASVVAEDVLPVEVRQTLADKWTQLEHRLQRMKSGATADQLQSTSKAFSVSVNEEQTPISHSTLNEDDFEDVMNESDDEEHISINYRASTVATKSTATTTTTPTTTTTTTTPTATTTLKSGPTLATPPRSPGLADGPQVSMEEVRRQIAGQQATAESITDSVYKDTQRLLTLFGLPFIVAPGEAEAQCAILEMNGLVSGCVTEDSDVWLFGAHTVYRHMFNRDKHVRRYSSKMLQQKTGLTREHLIQLAMLSGGDYTDGVQGVGCVTALELLAHFRHAAAGNPDDPIVPLRALKRWHTQLMGPAATRPTSLLKRQKQAKSWKFPASFPDEAVYKAYLHPDVDDSTEPCRWGRPDFEALVQFSQNQMGWSEHRCRSIIKPLVDRAVAEKAQPGLGQQTHITSFAVNVKFGEPSPTKSTRVAKAFNTILGKTTDDNASCSTQSTPTTNASSQQSSTSKPALTPKPLTSVPDLPVKRRQTRARKGVSGGGKAKAGAAAAKPAEVKLSESDSD